MKSPDEIKKGLECCTVPLCDECPYDNEPSCVVKNADALALIQQLQAENAEKDERIQQLEEGNAQLLEKVDRFSKAAFEQNMVILGKQDVITKQERVRANLQDEIWQLKQQVPRWISVEERLPEHMDDVLVWVGGLAEVGCHDENNDCWELYTYVGDGSVTHWMPLPEPPKEE